MNFALRSKGSIFYNVMSIKSQAEKTSSNKLEWCLNPGRHKKWLIETEGTIQPIRAELRSRTRVNDVVQLPKRWRWDFALVWTRDTSTLPARMAFLVVKGLKTKKEKPDDNSLVLDAVLSLEHIGCWVKPFWEVNALACAPHRKQEVELRNGMLCCLLRW